MSTCTRGEEGDHGGVCPWADSGRWMAPVWGIGPLCTTCRDRASIGPVGSTPFPQLPVTEPGVLVALRSLPIALRFVFGVGWDYESYEFCVYFLFAYYKIKIGLTPRKVGSRLPAVHPAEFQSQFEKP